MPLPFSERDPETYIPQILLVPYQTSDLPFRIGC